MCLISKEKCEGASLESSVCNSDRCPRQESWTQWSPWTSCSVTCGRGSKSRRRSCSVPSVSSSVILRDAAPRRGDCIPAQPDRPTEIVLQAVRVPGTVRRPRPAGLELTVLPGAVRGSGRPGGPGVAAPAPAWAG